jgi:RIO-like serine/threonine protein kinase
MARCKHNSGNIQQFTEICLDCGHNIYESDEEYEESLVRDIENLRSQLRKKNIEKLELQKEKLQKQLKGDDDDGKDIGW